MSWTDELSEPIHNYDDEYTRHIIKQTIKGGKNGAFIHYFESSRSNLSWDII